MNVPAFGAALITLSSLSTVSETPRLAPAREDVADDALRLLGGYHCSSAGVRFVAEATQRSTITFVGPEQRRERVEGRLQPLTAADFVGWLDAEVLALNFITGAEMSLGTLRWLRQAFSGDIVMDYHTLALTTDSDGRRSYCRRALCRRRACAPHTEPCGYGGLWRCFTWRTGRRMGSIGDTGFRNGACNARRGWELRCTGVCGVRRVRERLGCIRPLVICVHANSTTRRGPPVACDLRTRVAAPGGNAWNNTRFRGRPRNSTSE